MDSRLTALEEKISRVAALCEGLRAENASLHAQLAEALKMRDEYGRQMDAARLRLEALAAKLPGA
jgi:chromosome segregation ATPase